MRLDVRRGLERIVSPRYGRRLGDPCLWSNTVITDHKAALAWIERQLTKKAPTP